MIFQNPTAFLFLMLIPILFFLRKAKIFTRLSFPLTISDWNGKIFSWNKKYLQFFSFLSGLFFVLGFISLVFAFANPVIRHQEKIYTSHGTEILILLDTSPSMAAKDMQYMNTTLNRLDAARLGIKTIVENEKGATFALISMASESASVVPPTTDHEIFLNRLDSLKIGELGDGSAIGTGLCSAIYHLASTKAPKKCIILITDGENNAGSIHPETAAKLASDNNITLYVLGIGTKGTVPIEYVDTKTGKVRSGYYESDFDSKPLEKIASISGGRYFGIESLGSLSESLSSIVNRESVVQTFRLKTVDEYCYYKFLIICAITFSISWFLRKVFLSEIL